MTSNFNALEVRSYLNDNNKTNDQDNWGINEPENRTLITALNENIGISRQVKPNPISEIKKLIQDKNRTELKSKIIANRITVLQNEELKAWRKVEEINKKRNEILMAYKRKQEEKTNDLNRKSEIYNVQNREKVQASKTRKIKNQGKVKEMLDGIKRKEIYLQKEKLKEMMITRQEYENSDLEIKKNLRQKTKEQSIIKNMKAEYYNILKKNRIKQFFDRKQKEQYNIVEIKEDQLKELEEIESSLLKKYEQTQKKQEKALNDLKNAITNKQAINNSVSKNSKSNGKGASKLNYSIDKPSKSFVN